MLPVLFAADESTGSLAAVRGLRAGGYAPWVAVSQPVTYAARSNAAAGVVRMPPPADDADAYADAAADAARSVGAAALLPGTESTLRAISGREDRFPSSVRVGTGGRDLLERVTDKQLFLELARDAGLETLPHTRVSGGALDRPLEELPLPAIVKPLRSVSAGDGARMRSSEVERVETRAQLESVLARLGDGDWLVEPYVTGTLLAICGVVWEGEVVCASHQLSPRIWPLATGTSAYAITVEPDAGRERSVARLLGELRWSGIFGVQFLAADGHVYAIDLNPRAYGSMALAIAAGHNLPAIWADLLLGRTPRVGAYALGVRYRYEEDDARALLHRLRAGDVAGALSGALPRRRTVHAVFSRRDPRPSLVSVRKVADQLRR